MLPGGIFSKMRDPQLKNIDLLHLSNDGAGQCLPILLNFREWLVMLISKSPKRRIGRSETSALGRDA